jgi:hypothetical protein
MTEIRDPLNVVIASAARFLIDGDENDAASILLSCNAELERLRISDTDGPELYIVTDICLITSRKNFDILADHSSQIRFQVNYAITSVFPSYYGDNYWSLDSTNVRAELIEVESNWKDELTDIALGRGINNQANRSSDPILWQGMKFRSVSEIRIAQALDSARVLFLPNCLARLNSGSARVNREPDFLVCQNGKWGILEVDGDPYHPPTRAAQDHERDRLFRSYGIRVVERFRADECFENSNGVVSKFLELLARS